MRHRIDLRLRGIEHDDLNRFESDLLQNHLFEERKVEYYKTMAIVYAIIEGSKVAAGNGGDFGKTSDMLSNIRNILFPEVAEDMEEKMARTEKLLKREAARGPIMVQARSYKKQRNKRR